LLEKKLRIRSKAADPEAESTKLYYCPWFFSHCAAARSQTHPRQPRVRLKHGITLDFLATWTKSTSAEGLTGTTKVIHRFLTNLNVEPGHTEFLTR
jgi:hypothetical protein